MLISAASPAALHTRVQIASSSHRPSAGEVGGDTKAVIYAATRTPRAVSQGVRAAEGFALTVVDNLRPVLSARILVRRRGIHNLFMEQ